MSVGGASLAEGMRLKYQYVTSGFYHNATIRYLDYKVIPQDQNLFLRLRCLFSSCKIFNLKTIVPLSKRRHCDRELVSISK